jgi:23S rRNA (uracil1939-C5)-methyltransferase
LSSIIKDKKYIVEISGMNHEGQGVGRIENFAVFIDGAIIEETVEVKIIILKKNYAVGKLIRVIKPSEKRITPFCPAYEKCGGCSLQHMNYKAQLDFKTNMVKDNIKRIGKLEDVVIHDTLGMEKAQYYRNKAQFPVGTVNGKPSIGFYAGRTHDIIDNTACGIQHDISDKVREIAREFILETGISAYSEIAGTGLIRHIVVRTGFKTGEVMVIVVINGNELPYKDRLIELLCERIDGLKSIMLNINTKNTNVIMGDKNIRIFGEDTISDYIGKYRFKISPRSFYQVNPLQTEVLYNKAMEYAQLTGKETVFDLYCGIGTISLFLSEKAKKVYGVEVVDDAIIDARENATLNGVGNAEFIVGEAEKVIPEMYQQGIRADVVVVDPPRKGCDEVLLKTLVEMQPERIVYVSCNPSTLARDLNYLDNKGYKAVEVQPVDMFPHTAHVETIVLITRVENQA